MKTLIEYLNQKDLTKVVFIVKPKDKKLLDEFFNEYLVRWGFQDNYTYDKKNNTITIIGDGEDLGEMCIEMMYNEFKVFEIDNFTDI